MKVILIILMLLVGGCQINLLVDGFDSHGESVAEMDVKRRKGDFRSIARQKIRQEDLPLDTRLYIAPDARIEGDRDYSDGKGY
jgi:hypothetical protein